MKKLNKLQINSDRIIKNEELRTLRGGYGVLKCLRREIFGGDCIFDGEDILCDQYDMLYCALNCFMSWGSICVGGSGY